MWRARKRTLKRGREGSPVGGLEHFDLGQLVFLAFSEGGGAVDGCCILCPFGQDGGVFGGC